MAYLDGILKRIGLVLAIVLGAVVLVMGVYSYVIGETNDDFRASICSIIVIIIITFVSMRILLKIRRGRPPRDYSDL